MPLAPHIIRTPAALPLEESVRQELVNLGERNLRAENVRPVDQGEARCRFGFAALGTVRFDGTSPTAGYKLFADRDSTCRITETPNLETYSSATDKWSSLGRVCEAAARLMDVPTISLGLTSATDAGISDLCYCNGYFVISWFAPTLTAATYSACASVVDATTNSVIRVPELLGATTATNNRPLLATYGVYVIAVWKSAAGTLTAMYLDTTSSTTINVGWVAFGAAVASDLIAVSAIYAIHSLSDRVAVFYVNNSAGLSQATCVTLNISGVLQTQTINTNSVTPARVALGGDPSDTLWLAWNEATLVRAQGLTPGALSSTKATKATVMTMASSVNFIGITHNTHTVSSGGAAVIANDTSGFQLRKNEITTVAGATTPSTEIRVPGANATGRPWAYGGRVYVTATAEAAQKTDTIVDFTDEGSAYAIRLRPVVCYAPGITSARSGFTQFCDGQRTTVVGSASSKFYVLTQVTKSGAADATQLVEIDFANSKRFQTVAFGNSTFLSGGTPSAFDSRRVAEIGFIYRPPTPTGVASGVGAINATYRYVVVYEEVDADGNWHQSGLSSPSSVVTLTNNTTVTVSAQPLSITSRIGKLTPGASSVRLAVYRTLTGGVAPYYRLGTISNDTTATSVTYVDTTTDATLAAAAKLYSQPGVLNTSQDKRSPPPFSSIVSYNGMLIGASGSDVWYSGQNVSGEGVWFNPIFSVPIPGDGDITALWAMDGTLFVAKRREIYALTGDPPTDNGASGGLGTPRRLAVDVGCIEPRSTCVTSAGTFFQSDRGIELLTRAQAIDWIGEHIQDTVTNYPICTSITLDPSNSGWVLVELAQTQTSGLTSGSGRTPVFKLESGEWVSIDHRNSVAGVASASSQSACIISTIAGYRYAWMDVAGNVHYENRTSYLDADHTFVTPLIETGWLNAFQNEQSVHLASFLFQRYTAAGLKVEVAYDYGDYDPKDNAVWSVADTIGQRQLEMAIAPRGETMKFRISTTAPTSLSDTGEGIGVFAIVLDLAAKQGPVKGTTRLDPALRR